MEKNRRNFLFATTAVAAVGAIAGYNKTLSTALSMEEMESQPTMQSTETIKKLKEKLQQLLQKAMM